MWKFAIYFFLFCYINIKCTSLQIPWNRITREKKNGFRVTWMTRIFGTTRFRWRTFRENQFIFTFFMHNRNMVIQYAGTAISLLCKRDFFYIFNSHHIAQPCQILYSHENGYEKFFSPRLWVSKFFFRLKFWLCGFFHSSIWFLPPSLYFVLYYECRKCENCVYTFKQTNCINTVYAYLRLTKVKNSIAVSNIQQAPNHTSTIHGIWQFERMRYKFRLRQHNQDTTRCRYTLCNWFKECQLNLNYAQYIYHFIPLFWFYHWNMQNDFEKNYF